MQLRFATEHAMRRALFDPSVTIAPHNNPVFL